MGIVIIQEDIALLDVAKGDGIRVEDTGSTQTGPPEMAWVFP